MGRLHLLAIRRFVAFVVAASSIALVVSCGSAHAHARHHHYRHHHHFATQYTGGGDPRPGAWCGWFMRHELGVADRAYNLARNWAHYGSAAAGPAIGALVVWPHHVGRITGGSPGAWIVRSGNDGHAVRERVRSVDRAIAFRWPA